MCAGGWKPACTGSPGVQPVDLPARRFRLPRFRHDAADRIAHRAHPVCRRNHGGGLWGTHRSSIVPVGRLALANRRQVLCPPDTDPRGSSSAHRPGLLFRRSTLTVLAWRYKRKSPSSLPTAPARSSRVAQLLGGERINMLAMSIDPSGQLRMVVDNPLHAAGTLREQHYNVEERDVLYTSMPNEPGALGRALKLLADAGINVDYAYASGIDRFADGRRGHRRCRCAESVLHHRHLTRDLPGLMSCDSSYRRWTRFWSNSMPTAAFDSTTRDGRRRRCRSAGPSFTPRTIKLEQLKELLDVLESEP